MATLTRDQAMSYAYDAGFRGDAQKVIVAIAYAESGFNTTARNCYGLFGSNRGGAQACDRGILQFNSYWHPEVTNDCADNPSCAFQQAYRVSGSGTKFSAWTTYNNSEYKKYLSGVPVNTPPTNLPGILGLLGTNNTVAATGGAIKATDTLGNLVSTLGNISQAFTTLTKPDTWIRVGLFAFAIVLLIVGMMVLGLGGSNVKSTR
jgi:hypothetical protein